MEHRTKDTRPILTDLDDNAHLLEPILSKLRPQLSHCHWALVVRLLLAVVLQLQDPYRVVLLLRILYGRPALAVCHGPRRLDSQLARRRLGQLVEHSPLTPPPCRVLLAEDTSGRIHHARSKRGPGRDREQILVLGNLVVDRRDNLGPKVGWEVEVVKKCLREGVGGDNVVWEQQKSSTECIDEISRA